MRSSPASRLESRRATSPRIRVIRATGSRKAPSSTRKTRIGFSNPGFVFGEKESVQTVTAKQISENASKKNGRVIQRVVLIWFECKAVIATHAKQAEPMIGSKAKMLSTRIAKSASTRSSGERPRSPQRGQVKILSISGRSPASVHRIVRAIYFLIESIGFTSLSICVPWAARIVIGS